MPGTDIDPTIGAFRANAAAAQYSREVAMEMYGGKRPYGYAFGGSGGGFRTIAGAENTEGVWDGVVPYVIGSPMSIPNVFTVRTYAMRVLEETAKPAFLQNVRELSRTFKTGFESLKEKHPEILVGLRQLGLMMGIVMVNEHCGPILSKTLFDNGVLSVYANNNPRVSQLLPPLIIDQKLAAEILERVDRGLADAKAFLGL